MHTRSLPRWIARSQSWWSRIAVHTHHTLTALRRAWHQRRRLDRELRERALAAELDPRMLRDIGAPEWLQAEAAALRQARRDQRERLRMGVVNGDGRFW
jgi:hypothetical protein